jgi:hypothetical protein
MTFTAYNTVLGHELNLRVGHATAQEVSHCHPTVGSIPGSQREFVVDKVVLEHVFSKYFSFPLLYTHLTSGAGRTGKTVANIQSGLSLTHLHKLKEKVEICNVNTLMFVIRHHKNLLVYIPTYQFFYTLHVLTAKWPSSGTKHRYFNIFVFCT